MPRYQYSGRIGHTHTKRRIIYLNSFNILTWDILDRYSLVLHIQNRISFYMLDSHNAYNHLEQDETGLHKPGTGYHNAAYNRQLAPLKIGK